MWTNARNAPDEHWTDDRKSCRGGSWSLRTVAGDAVVAGDEAIAGGEVVVGPPVVFGTPVRGHTVAPLAHWRLQKTDREEGRERG